MEQTRLDTLSTLCPNYQINVTKASVNPQFSRSRQLMQFTIPYSQITDVPISSHIQNLFQPFLLDPLYSHDIKSAVHLYGGQPIFLDTLNMGLVTLPLHIWDRELDSRILLSALLLSDNHQVILGHEYNISPLYKKIPYIFHYGPGRPVFNVPRTTDWYEPIVANGGFNGLVFEEGVNDIMLNASMSFPGINNRSVASTSKIFAWCDREVDQMVAAHEDLASNLRTISTPYQIRE